MGAKEGGQTAFKILGVGWALLLVIGLFYWLRSKQGVGGPAFAMLVRTALCIGAFRVAGAISAGRLARPRPLAVGFLVALLVIVWLGMAGSASPNSSVGFLSIQSLYSREPGAFIPELRMQPRGLPRGDVVLLGFALMFVLSLVAVIRARPATAA